MDRYYKNGYIIESDLQIQCNPHQNSHDILHRTRKSNPKIHMEAISGKKSNAGGIVVPDLKFYYRAIVARYHSTQTKIDTQTNRIE
jgi:hypothetical protein